MIGAGERLYRVLWIACDPRTGEATGKRGVLCPGPFTHDEACTCLRKTTPHRKVSYLLEEIRDDEPAASVAPLTHADLTFLGRYARAGAAEARHEGNWIHANRLRELGEKCDALAALIDTGTDDDEQPIPEMVCSYDEDDTGADSEPWPALADGGGS